MIVWLNPEDVETAFVKVNRYAETEHDRLVLAKELRRVQEQIAPLKTLHNSIKIDFAIPKRRTLVDGQTLALGRRFDEAKERDESQSRLAKTDARETARLGLSVPIKGSLDERTRRELEELDSL